MSDTDIYSRVIYREGLSLKLGTKGETVNKAKYSTGSKKEA